MNEETKYDLIERYLAGSSSPAEKLLVEEKLQNDPDFRKEFDVHKDLQKTLGNKDIKDLENQIQAVLKQERPKKEFQLWPYLAAVAAVAILVLIYQVGKSTSSDAEAVIAQYYNLPKEFNSSTTFRNEGTSPQVTLPNSSLDSFYTSYQNGTFQLALDILEERIKNQADSLDLSELQILYYEGILYLQLEQYDAALERLDLLVQNGGNVNATWYKAFTLLHLNGWTAESQDLLNTLANQPNPYQKDAKAILKKLK